MMRSAVVFIIVCGLSGLFGFFLCNNSLYLDIIKGHFSFDLKLGGCWYPVSLWVKFWWGVSVLTGILGIIMLTVSYIIPKEK